MTKKTRWLFFVLCVLPWRYLCFFDFGIWQPILLVLFSIGIPTVGFLMTGIRLWEQVPQQGKIVCLISMFFTAVSGIAVTGDMIDSSVLFNLPGWMFVYVIVVLYRDLIYIEARLMSFLFWILFQKGSKQG